MNNPIFILLLDSHLSIAEKIARMRAVGKPMSLDLDPDISAQGLLLLAAALTMEQDETKQQNAQAVATSATETVHADEKTSAGVYETSVELLEKKFPNNTAKWLLYSAILSSAGTKAGIPGQVKDVSVVQSEFDGHGNMHFHHVKGATIYFVYETQGNPLDPTTYFPANPKSFNSSKGGQITPKTAGIPSNWIVVAHGNGGEGPPSAPYPKTIH
jgi:hypothetical protein